MMTVHIFLYNFFINKYQTRFSARGFFLVDISSGVLQQATYFAQNHEPIKFVD